MLSRKPSACLGRGERRFAYGVTDYSGAPPGLVRESFARAEEVAPAARKLLGCYLWDYGANQPLPLDRLAYQCETGLDWLKQSRLDGIIFLASCICDLRLEAVEWTRNWISQLSRAPA